MFPVQTVVIRGQLHVNDCMFEKNKRLSELQLSKSVCPVRETETILNGSQHFKCSVLLFAYAYCKKFYITTEG